MSVTFLPTQDDLRAAAGWLRERLPAAGARRRASVVSFFGAIAAAIVAAVAAIATGSALTYVAAVLALLAGKASMRLQVSSLEGRMGVEVTYVADEVGLTLSRAAVRTTCPWSAVQDAGESATHFFLVLPFDEAMVVPKRVFATPDDVLRFHRLAIAKASS